MIALRQCIHQAKVHRKVVVVAGVAARVGNVCVANDTLVPKPKIGIGIGIGIGIETRFKCIK
jgi:hypothetical protein